MVKLPLKDIWKIPPQELVKSISFRRMVVVGTQVSFHREFIFYFIVVQQKMNNVKRTHEDLINLRKTVCQL